MSGTLHYLARLSFLVLTLAAALRPLAARSADIPVYGLEGPDATWTDGGGDLSYGMAGPQRVQDDVHGGSWCEQVHVTGSGGTYVYVAHAVEPALVVAELTPSVWLKANRPGLQIIARVILPHTPDPRTGQPLQTLVRGSSYSQPGTWQQLRIPDIHLALSRQLRVLRSQLGPSVDEREAYVDQVLINVYGGTGRTSARIDDLQLEGFVSRAAIREVQPVAYQATPEPAPRDVRLQGNSLLVEGHPFFPRSIEYQGESLELLRQLGFNCVHLSAVPTAELMDEARRASIWLISPPPVTSGRIDQTYDQVLVWDLGRNLSSRDLAPTDALVKQSRQSDSLRSRPIICGARSELRAYSRLVDFLVDDRTPLSTSLELSDYVVWLREWPRLARPGTPIFATVPTQLAPEIVEQVRLIAPAAAERTSLDEESMRLMVHTAISAGVRGLVFRSQSRLDATDPATRRRAQTLELINLELDLLQPWAAAGSFVTAVTSGDPQITGAMLQTDRARVLLPIRSAAGAQYVSRSVPSTISFVVPFVPDPHEFYELTPAGIRPMRQKRRVAGGIHVTLDDFGLSSMIVMTADPAVVGTLYRRLAAGSRRATQLQRDLAASSLLEAQQSMASLTGRIQADDIQQFIVAAQANLSKCDSLLTAGDLRGAFAAAGNAVAAVRTMKRAIWETAVGPLGSPVATPLTSSFSTLPQYWPFLQQVAASPLSGNRLIGGDCEKLETLIASGWKHFEHPEHGVQTRVEVAPLGDQGGGACLLLKAVAADEAAPPILLETPPLWVTTAPIPVDRGDLLCIRGRVRIDQPVTASVDGLMILDSLGGAPLAMRIGQTSGWRSFTLYRAVGNTGDFTITFALSGLGEARVDDISVQFVGRAPAAGPTEPLQLGIAPRP